MPDKRLIVENRSGGWDVRIPGAHKPESQHDTFEEAEQAAHEWRERVGDGRVTVIL